MWPGGGGFTFSEGFAPLLDEDPDDAPPEEAPLPAAAAAASSTSHVALGGAGAATASSSSPPSKSASSSGGGGEGSAAAGTRAKVPAPAHYGAPAASIRVAVRDEPPALVRVPGWVLAAMFLWAGAVGAAPRD